MKNSKSKVIKKNALFVLHFKSNKIMLSKRSLYSINPSKIAPLKVKEMHNSNLSTK